MWTRPAIIIGGRRMPAVLLLALLMLPIWHMLAQAAEFRTRARHAIIMDAASGEVFFNKNADMLMPPASMSKIMTMVVVFDMLKKGQLSEDDEFEISVDAWKRGGAPSGGSTMYAKPGERIKLRDLMRGVIVVSANDAAIAIAEGISGSEEAFAQLMTRHARSIGLTKSTFANATGLPDPRHRMTARELALLARYLIHTFPEYYKLYSIREFEWNGIRQRNRNPLLGRYPGADGVKTGFTRESGYGLVASAVRDGRRLIAVISGLRSKRERAEEARKILDFGFRQFRPLRLYRANERVGKVRVWGGEKDFVPLVVHEDITVRLTDGERQRARLKVRYEGPLAAPVRAGQKVGELMVFVGKKKVASWPLYTGEDVAEDEAMFGRAMDTVKAWLFGS